MSFWTAKRRFATKSFANPEDIKGNEGAKVDLANDEVERVRRSHLVSIFSGFQVSVVNFRAVMV